MASAARNARPDADPTRWRCARRHRVVAGTLKPTAIVTSRTPGETGIVPTGLLEQEIRNRCGCRPFADLLDWSGERRRIAAKHLRRGDHD